MINELNGSTFASHLMSQAQKGGTVEELQKLQAHSCRGILKVKAGMRSALWFPDVFTVNFRGEVPAMSRLAQDGRFCFGSCHARFLKDVHFFVAGVAPVMLRSSTFLCVTGAGHPTLFDLCGRRPLFGRC